MIDDRIAKIQERTDVCWKMAWVFLENKDAHGIHDMGVEIQALQRALVELEAIKENLIER
jgi:hypothetical protein